MPSNTSKTNKQKCSPPKKSKNCKINDARESLGEFEASVFDASNGHKLVDLIRKKKGLHVQTQKIFDDVPSQRPSLQIEIQRLDHVNDNNNETLRQPDEPTSSAAACAISEAAVASQPNCSFIVPKSPKRLSSIGSVSRPINIGRRTLLKEFEKAFLNESRFLPQTCSTPITSDVPCQIGESNDSVRPDENILPTPITISSEGSLDDRRNSMGKQLPNNSSNTETLMRALALQNDMLNALVQSSGETTIRKENPIPKSPSRLYTVECDISSGKLTLSPAKSNQQNHNHERHPLLPKAQVKTPIKNTKKLIATPEQRKILLKRLGMGLSKGNSPQKIVESVQKTSRIPVFSKATPLPSLTNQQTATAELVEQLQNNMQPNCPLVVIPVNQIFNQPVPHRNTFTDVVTQPIRSPTPYEITSTMRDNVAQSSGSDNYIHNNMTREATRVESPASNGISSTTISNGEAFKGKVPEPPAISLRWNDIITDDSSSPDKSHGNSPSKNKRGRLRSKRRNSQKHRSTTSRGSNKLSLSHKCLDLRVRARRSDGRLNKSRQSSAKIDDELCDKRHEDNLPRRRSSSRKTFTIDQQQIYEEGVEILSQQSQSDFSTIDGHSGNNLPQRSNRNTLKIDEQREGLKKILSEQPQRKTLEIDEQQRDEERQQSMSLRSRDEHRSNLLPQQPQRKTFTIEEQRDEEPEELIRILSGEHRRKTLEIDEQQSDEEGQQSMSLRSREEYRSNLLPQQPQRKTFTIEEQRDEEREELIRILSGQPQRKTLTIDEQQSDDEGQQSMSLRSREEHRSNLLSQQPQRKTFTIEEQRDEEREELIRILSEQPQRKTLSIDEQQREEEREQNLSRRSRRRDTSKVDENRDEQRRILSPKQPQRKTLTIDEQQRDEEREQNLSGRSRRRDTSKVDENRDEQRRIFSPKQPQRKTLTIDEQQRDEEREQNSSGRSQRDTSKVDEQHGNLSSHQPQLKTSTIDENQREERQQNSSHSTESYFSAIDKPHDVTYSQRCLRLNKSKDAEVLPPPDAFCDLSLSSFHNSKSFEKDQLVDEVSSDKISLEKFQHPGKVISKKKRSKKTIPQHLKQYLEANKKVSKRKILNVSKRKLYSKGNSDASSSSSDTTPEKILKRNPVSPLNKKTLGKLPKEPRKSNKSATAAKNNNNNSERATTTEETTSHTSSLHLDNERSTVSPNSPAKTPPRSYPVDRNSQKNTPMFSPSRLSRLHSNSKASPVRTSKQNKNEHSKAVDRITEKDTPMPSSSRHSNRNASPVNSSKQSTEPVAIDVEIPALPPPKAPPKRKYTKKTKTLIDQPQTSGQSEDNASSTTNSDNNNCGGPRRSSRKTKPPSAYWSCPNSQYTHVSDIYAMLTAGKRPYFPESIIKPKTKKKKEPSKNDNLVANTNSIKSTSEKSTNKNKQKNKKKVTESGNLPPAIPEETYSTTENRDMNNEEHHQATTSELEAEPQQSTTERQISKDTTTSHSKTKANKKTKKSQIVEEEQDEVQNIPHCSAQLSTNSSSTDSSRTNSNSRRTQSKKRQEAEETPVTSSDCPSEDDNNLSFHKRRLETIAENIQELVNPVQPDDISPEERLSGTLMPPPATSVVVKKGKKSQKQQKQHKSFHTEHDKSIADVSSLHVNNLFEQLKNSSNISKMNSMCSNEQASLSSSSSTNNRNKEFHKNVSVRVRRMQLPEGSSSSSSSYVVNERNFDSGFTSMNSINPKKDILLDWIVQMLNNGKTTISSDEGLARLLKPDGCSSSRADELIFEEIDGVDFAFYHSAYTVQKFGYLRFKPKTRKKASCAKKYELNFVLLGGTVRITINDQSFDMKNGDLTTIFIGTTYRIDNVSDDPALVMVIKS